MTSDAKIGLLLGLIFIFVVAFIINGLPNLKPQTTRAEVSTNMVSLADQSIGVADHAQVQAEQDWRGLAAEQEPQTPAEAEPFPAWHLVGKKLCDDLDATIVDDQGQPVALHAFDTIGRELDELYRKLDALDLAAGSAAARRLFS